MREDVGPSIIHESEYKHLAHHLPHDCVIHSNSMYVNGVNNLPLNITILRGKWLRRYLCAHINFTSKEIWVYEKDMYTFFTSWGRTHGYKKLNKEWRGVNEKRKVLFGKN